jgi:AcrR family transcriptional regulator
VAALQTVIWMRPEHAKAGRPAERSRALVTAAAIKVADRDGLDAVSMRRVAAELGTGAASLYRYIATRDDLLDLMADATGAEYALAAPSGNWLADLVGIASQARAIMLRHPWLPALVITRATLGPHGVDLVEHFLNVLSDHPADPAAKLEAFGILMAVTATFVQHEAATDQAARQRQAAYLRHVTAAGRHPQLTALLAAAIPPTDPADQFAALLSRILTGLLATTAQTPMP